MSTATISKKMSRLSTADVTEHAGAKKKQKLSVAEHGSIITILSSLPGDLVGHIFNTLNAVDITKLTMTSKQMHVRVVSILAGTVNFQRLELEMMSTLLRTFTLWDDKQRSIDWDYMTLRERQLPALYSSQHTPDNLTGYATYLEFKYRQYYVLSRSRADTVLRHLKRGISTVVLDLSVSGIPILTIVRRQATEQMGFTWVNRRACYTATEIDLADSEMMVQVEDGHEDQPQRRRYEANLLSLVQAQAKPHDGTMEAPYFFTQ